MSYTQEEFFKERTILNFKYYGKNYNNTRRSKLISLECCMKKYPPFLNSINKNKQERLIELIERSCYNQTCTKADEENIPKNWQNRLFCQLYNMITYKVQTNLLYCKTDSGSDYLIKQILANDYNINNIAKLSSRELRPDRSDKIHEEIEKRRQQKINKKISAQHECFKCGGRKTTETEVQMRSLDEGSTLIIRCEMENCNNVWKIST